MIEFGEFVLKSYSGAVDQSGQERYSGPFLWTSTGRTLPEATRAALAPDCVASPVSRRTTTRASAGGGAQARAERGARYIGVCL